MYYKTRIRPFELVTLLVWGKAEEHGHSFNDS